MRKLSIPLIALALAILISCGGPGTEYTRSLVVKTDVYPGADWTDKVGDKVIIMFIVGELGSYEGIPMTVWPLRADEALKNIEEGEFGFVRYQALGTESARFRYQCWIDKAEWRLGYLPIMVCPTPGYTRNDFIGVVFRLE